MKLDSNNSDLGCGLVNFADLTCPNYIVHVAWMSYDLHILWQGNFTATPVSCKNMEFQNDYYTSSPFADLHKQRGRPHGFGFYFWSNLMTLTRKQHKGRRIFIWQYSIKGPIESFVINFSMNLKILLILHSLAEFATLIADVILKKTRQSNFICSSKVGGFTKIDAYLLFRLVHLDQYFIGSLLSGILLSFHTWLITLFLFLFRRF